MDADPWLRRLELQALAICLAMAALGLAIGGVSGALSVIAGGLLIGIVYESVKGATDRAFRRGQDRPDRGWRDGWRLVKFFTRYAILAVAAYVILVRLRLHVTGVLLGASSFVLALFVEAARVLAGRGKPRLE
ncbi:MAG TPA: hypothetical protein VIC33_11515 [Vicinamibacterales bacterium]